MPLKIERTQFEVGDSGTCTVCGKQNLRILYTLQATEDEYADLPGSSIDMCGRCFVNFPRLLTKAYEQFNSPSFVAARKRGSTSASSDEIEAHTSSTNSGRERKNS